MGREGNVTPLNIQSVKKQPSKVKYFMPFLLPQTKFMYSSVSNQCTTYGRRCGETCVPVPRSYHCSCSVGSKLASDKLTCIKSMYVGNQLFER